ncbi:MAG: hypothetical protein IKA02_06040, partial [Clostridia bacterium]|nr:hypothetical protein [Clostridia bacterium]
LKATAKEGEERLNKYSVTMATAKCARMITNEYIKQRVEAEKKAKDKDEKDVYATVKKEYRDEKAVKNALRELNNGEFEVLLPGDEGYEESTVVVENYVKEVNYENEKPALTVIKTSNDTDIDEEIEDEDDEFELPEELMGASEVFDNDAGFSIQDDEEN